MPGSFWWEMWQHPGALQAAAARGGALAKLVPGSGGGDAWHSEGATLGLAETYLPFPRVGWVAGAEPTLTAAWKLSPVPTGRAAESLRSIVDVR